MKFDEFFQLARKGKGGDSKSPPTHLLALDPGMTTGWAYYLDGGLHRHGQVHTVTPSDLINFVQSWEPLESVVCEDYRVYEHKAKSNVWKEQHEPKLIGALEYWCASNHIELTLQMASQAKGFVGDDRLNEWGLYVTGQPHARDAIRHGCYYLIFRK